MAVSGSRKRRKGAFCDVENGDVIGSIWRKRSEGDTTFLQTSLRASAENLAPSVPRI
jgi:hypothetical protein